MACAATSELPSFFQVSWCTKGFFFSSQVLNLASKYPIFLRISPFYLCLAIQRRMPLTDRAREHNKERQQHRKNWKAWKRDKVLYTLQLYVLVNAYIIYLTVEVWCQHVCSYVNDPIKPWKVQSCFKRLFEQTSSPKAVRYSTNTFLSHCCRDVD